MMIHCSSAVLHANHGTQMMSTFLMRCVIALNFSSVIEQQQKELSKFRDYEVPCMCWTVGFFQVLSSA